MQYSTFNSGIIDSMAVLKSERREQNGKRRDWKSISASSYSIASQKIVVQNHQICDLEQIKVSVLFMVSKLSTTL